MIKIDKEGGPKKGTQYGIVQNQVKSHDTPTHACTQIDKEY